ncbi:hypothetical protein [Streptomyces sp. NPDC019539]|uniref:hypothetical protein n=1 Tax=Streptomyces sp. NPDC019539 TaxID=3365063 RepID=UPI0037BC8607
MVIKTECIRGRVFATRAEGNLALFEYIDGFYTPAAARNGSATSARSSTRRSTTPTRQRPNKSSASPSCRRRRSARWPRISTSRSPPSA